MERSAGFPIGRYGRMPGPVDSTIDSKRAFLSVAALGPIGPSPEAPGFQGERNGQLVGSGQSPEGKRAPVFETYLALSGSVPESPFQSF
jgi:hypothetical protein